MTGQLNIDFMGLSSRQPCFYGFFTFASLASKPSMLLLIIKKELLSKCSFFLFLHRQVGKILSVMACPGRTSRACGHAHANICSGYLLMGLNCWRAPTEDKGFAGRKAPTKAPAGREKPARVGVPRRNFKGLRACPRQHLRRLSANRSQLLACSDVGQRLCGEEGANFTGTRAGCC